MIVVYILTFFSFLAIMVKNFPKERNKMVTRKEDTARRQSRRKYEEKNKEQRKETNSNFQTMIPRELYEEISSFLKEIGMTKVQFIKEGYEYLIQKHHPKYNDKNLSENVLDGLLNKFETDENKKYFRH